jgi:hypothetical protein
VSVLAVEDFPLFKNLFLDGPIDATRDAPAVASEALEKRGIAKFKWYDPSHSNYLSPFRLSRLDLQQHDFHRAFLAEASEAQERFAVPFLSVYAPISFQ